MDMFDILESICDTVHAAFPEHDIHISSAPQGFKRPSFLVSMIGFADQDAWQGAMRRQTPFQVVYFAPKDQRGNVDTASQYAAYIKLTSLFQGHSFPVKGRYPKITAVDGGPRDGEVYLSITFEYWFSPEGSGSAEDAYEQMTELQMKYQN